VRIGDLVMTDDGYYGIIVADHEVFLGNGCQQIMDGDAWSKLQSISLNIYQAGVTANFAELMDRSFGEIRGEV